MEKVLLIDVDIDKKFLDEFKRFELIIEDAKDLTNNLIKWSAWAEFNPDSTLIIFPGNGADIVQRYLPKSILDNWNCARVHAKRYWVPGENPRVVTNRIYPEKMLLGIKNVLIIDDVISSGKTCKNLRTINMPWMPGADWHAATWLMQKSASTKGFLSVFAVKTFGNQKAKAPINSLSTLLEDREIAISYCERNFPNDKDKFIKLLDSIKLL